MLAQPKGARRGNRRKELMRTFDPSPVTGQPVQMFDGRYGPYVTDGTTNASLPRGMTPDGLTGAQALELLAERAARGPARPTGRGRAPAKTAKKAPARKTAKKKTAKKKAPAKRPAPGLPSADLTGISGQTPTNAQMAES